MHRAARRSAHDEPAQRVEVDRLAEHADVDLPPLGFDPPGRHLHVLLPERLDNFRDGEALLLEPPGVDPDPDVPFEVAAEHDLSDALHGLDPVLDAVARVVRKHLPRERAGESDP